MLGVYSVRITTDEVYIDYSVGDKFIDIKAYVIEGAYLSPVKSDLNLSTCMYCNTDILSIYNYLAKLEETKLEFIRELAENKYNIVFLIMDIYKHLITD